MISQNRNSYACILDQLETTAMFSWNHTLFEETDWAIYPAVDIISHNSECKVLAESLGITWWYF